jgi:hypothetical protein
MYFYNIFQLRKCILLIETAVGKKEKKKSTKQEDQPQPDFSKSSLTKGLGKPIEGKPLNEEDMIVMEGKLNAPPQSANIPTNDNEENVRHEL